MGTCWGAFRVSFILLSLVLGCNSGGTEQQRPALKRNSQISSWLQMTPENNWVTLDLGKKAKSKLMVSDILESDFSVIRLETLKDVFIGEIEKVIVKGDYLFVFDKKIAKQLFMFERSGKFVRKIGLRGRGPEEIDSPLDFDVTDDRIFLIDRQSRLFEFDWNGVMFSRKLVPFLATHVKMLSIDNIFLYTHEYNEHNKYALVQIDENLNLQSQDFGLEKGMDRFGVQQAFFPSSSRPMFLRFLIDTVYSLSIGEISPKYVFAGKSNGLSAQKNKIDRNTGLIYSRGLAENSENLIFHYIEGNEIHIGIYWLRSGRLETYRSIYDDYFIGAMDGFLPVGVDGDAFMFVLNTYDWVNNLERIQTNLENDPKEKRAFLGQVKEQMTKIGNVNFQDNPMLLITKLRGM